MRPILAQLIELLTLTPLGDDRFRGQSQDLGWGTVFGGHVVGQALSAAAQTVADDRPAHSLHAYFLRPGNVSLPIDYEVDRVRDGRSFSTRRVLALQDGRAIFNLAASFHIEESGFSHQSEMPDVPGPEGLPDYIELLRGYLEGYPGASRLNAVLDRPIETRPVDLQNPVKPVPGPPKRHVWYRAPGQLPDDPAVHRFLLAYASDFHLVTTSTQPHGVSWLTPGVQIASLDHAIWFHRPFRMDEWLLHVMESPTACCGRGLVRGQFFDQAGNLVASTTQEGLIRPG